MTFQTETSIQKGSPLWVEMKLLSLYKVISESLIIFFGKFPVVFFAFVALIAGYASYCYPQIRHFMCPPQLELSLYEPWVKSRMWPIVFLYCLGPLIWFLRKKSDFYNSIVFAAISMAFVFFNSARFSFGVFRIGDFATSYLFLVLPMLTLLKKQSGKKIALMILSTIFLVFLEVFIRREIGSVRRAASFLPTGRLVIPLILIVLEYKSYGWTLRLKDFKLLSYLFSPVLFLHPQPIPISRWHRKEDQFPAMFQGFVDLLACSAAFFICAILLLHVHVRQDLHPLLQLFLDGTKLSLSYLFGSFGVFRLAVGLGRWLGYNLPDATNFAILATSPLESWKRWSIYLYNWMFIVTFLPVLRKTKSNTLAVSFSFLVLFLTHFPNILPNLVVWSHTPFERKVWLIKNLLFFLSHGLLIYLSLRFKNAWPESSRLNGWWGVIANRILLGCVHAVLL